MERKGVPIRGCPIGILTVEHQRGRALVSALASAVETHAKNGEPATKSLIQALKSLTELYPGHIWKEDYLLFPMTNKILNSEDQNDLRQKFEMVEKKFIKSLADEISRSGASTVGFVNLEAIALGPHKGFLYAICGGLAELVDSLEGRTPVPPWPNFVKFDRKIEVTGIIQDPWVLPWKLVSKIDKTFKGLPTPSAAMSERD